MDSILEGVARQLDGGTIDGISQQIGADPATTTDAIRVALPVLLGGLASNAETPEGAQALDTALARDHDGGLLDELGAMLGGGAGGSQGGDALGGLGGVLGEVLGGALGGSQSSGAGGGANMGGLGGGIGAAILAHILGRRQGQVTDGIGRSTGLRGDQVMQLLVILAPIVMAYLGRRKRERNLDANAVGDELRRERDHMEQKQPGLGGLLGQVFDRNGDGSVTDDLFRMAPNVLGGLLGGNR